MFGSASRRLERYVPHASVPVPTCVFRSYDARARLFSPFVTCSVGPDCIEAPSKVLERVFTGQERPMELC